MISRLTRIQKYAIASIFNLILVTSGNLLSLSEKCVIHVFAWNEPLRFYVFSLVIETCCPSTPFSPIHVIHICTPRDHRSLHFIEMTHLTPL